MKKGVVTILILSVLIYFIEGTFYKLTTKALERDLNYVILAGGENHFVALKDGYVYCWGDNSNEQCNVPAGINNAIAVAAGSNHSVALNEDGTVVCWGDNKNMQCEEPSDLNNVVAISAGKNFSIALKSDGSIVRWGKITLSKVSNNDPINFDLTNNNATKPEDLKNIKSMSCSHDTMLFITSEGKILEWTDTSAKDVNLFRRNEINEGTSNKKTIDIGIGDGYRIYLKEDGNVESEGWYVKEECFKIRLDNIKAISSRQNHSLALKSDSRVYGWGIDEYGETRVSDINKAVKAIATTNNCSAVYYEDGTVYSWGLTKEFIKRLPKELTIATEVTQKISGSTPQPTLFKVPEPVSTPTTLLTYTPTPILSKTPEPILSSSPPITPMILATPTPTALSIKENLGSNSSKEISVLLNGKKLEFDVQPVILNGRTLVPLRKIFESLGAEVLWDSSKSLITGKKPGVNVSLVTESSQANVNGITKILDVPATVINGRTLVPIRFISESFGAKVSWDAKNRTVIIE